MSLIGHLLEPQVDRHLLASEGEVVLDEVHKHWAAIFWPVVGLVVCVPLFVSMVISGPYFWIPLLAGMTIFCWSLIAIHIQYMDRFVITNMRVFRVHGVLNQNIATMPINRILDISVARPFLGQVCGYGHFVFETAAQDQGLRDIKFVGDPERRDLLIQQIIQKAGLRAQVSGIADGS